jgi:serine protease AprX
MLSGTSMATPVVTGAVADILQAHPQLTPDQVKARIMKTAYKVFPTSSTAVDPVTGIAYISQYDIFTVGAGYLDLAAALANTDVAGGTALSPTAVLNPDTGAVTLSFDSTSTWDDTYLSGTGNVSGDRACGAPGESGVHRPLMPTEECGARRPLGALAPCQTTVASGALVGFGVPVTSIPAVRWIPLAVSGERAVSGAQPPRPPIACC